MTLNDNLLRIKEYYVDETGNTGGINFSQNTFNVIIKSGSIKFDHADGHVCIEHKEVELFKVQIKEKLPSENRVNKEDNIYIKYENDMYTEYKQVSLSIKPQKNMKIKRSNMESFEYQKAENIEITNANIIIQKEFNYITENPIEEYFSLGSIYIDQTDEEVKAFLELLKDTYSIQTPSNKEVKSKIVYSHFVRRLQSSPPNNMKIDDEANNILLKIFNYLKNNNAEVFIEFMDKSALLVAHMFANLDIFLEDPKVEILYHHINYVHTYMYANRDHNKGFLPEYHTFKYIEFLFSKNNTNSLYENNNLKNIFTEYRDIMDVDILLNINIYEEIHNVLRTTKVDKSSLFPIYVDRFLNYVKELNFSVLHNYVQVADKTGDAEFSFIHKLIRSLSSYFKFNQDKLCYNDVLFYLKLNIFFNKKEELQTPTKKKAFIYSPPDFTNPKKKDQSQKKMVFLPNVNAISNLAFRMVYQNKGNIFSPKITHDDQDQFSYAIKEYAKKWKVNVEFKKSFDDHKLQLIDIVLGVVHSLICDKLNDRFKEDTQKKIFHKIFFIFLSACNVNYCIPMTHKKEVESTTKELNETGEYKQFINFMRKEELNRLKEAIACDKLSRNILMNDYIAIHEDKEEQEILKQKIFGEPSDDELLTEAFIEYECKDEQERERVRGRIFGKDEPHAILLDELTLE